MLPPYSLPEDIDVPTFVPLPALVKLDVELLCAVAVLLEVDVLVYVPLFVVFPLDVFVPENELLDVFDCVVVDVDVFCCVAFPDESLVITELFVDDPDVVVWPEFVVVPCDV